MLEQSVLLKCDAVKGYSFWKKRKSAQTTVNRLPALSQVAIECYRGVKFYKIRNNYDRYFFISCAEPHDQTPCVSGVAVSAIREGLDTDHEALPIYRNQV